MVLRLLSAVAANESATKSRRVKRKMDQNAHAGLPHGGYRRPYGYEDEDEDGYEDDKITVKADEAQVIRDLAERLLAGESIRSLAMRLDNEGVKTVGGGPWRTPTLSALLTSGRIAGLREHRGQVVGPAIWDAIISEQQRARILTLTAERAVSGRRSPRRHLLSGLLRCARCDGKLFSSPRDHPSLCVPVRPDHGGCGRLTVTAEPLEHLIADGVLFRLDTCELADALAGRALADDRTAALALAITEDTLQLEELASLYAAKDITAGEWMTARNPIKARITRNEQAVSRATRSDALTGWVGNGAALRAQWSSLNLTRQHAIVRALLDHAVVHPGTQGAHALDPARIVPVWRL